MEQYSQYLMSVKSSNSILMNPYSSHSSWEEQAFAEDARGPLGGFVWPPRSYSCSFCRREFRSAQALGGHMNVHRREKAKLKQTVNGTATSDTTITNIASQKHNKQSLCKKTLDPGPFPSARSPSGVSSIPATLVQEISLDSINSDTKSCVYDDDFAVVHGNGDNETKLLLGFDLDSCSNAGSCCKRQKTGAKPSASMDGLDLELRLTC